MSTTARLLVDPETVPISAAIRAAAQAASMLVIEQRALVDLASELGGMDDAVATLQAIVEDLDRPLGVNVETGANTSSTTFLAPQTWSPERLRGWVAAKHEELAAEFGAVTRVGVGSGP